MLIESGDLIPVTVEAVNIPWTKRKTEVLNFLHRGRVTFQTYVYDTNVGDIAPLSTYFNPRKWTVRDLNTKFGQRADGFPDHRNFSPFPSSSDTKSLSLQPKLLLYPEVMKSENSGVGLKNPNKRMSPSRIWSVPPPSISTPNLSSQLPSPPSKSPPNSNEDDNPGPIGAKRRKLSLNDCHTYFRDSSRSSLLGISDHGASTRSRSVSPSSGDSQFGLADVKSPLLCFDSAKIWSMVQDEDQIFKSNESNKPSDKVCDFKNNEKSAQTLSRNTDVPRIW